MKAKNKTRIRNIRIILWDKDLDVSALARQIGKSRTWTSQVLYGHEKSPETRAAIAEALDVKVEELWPNNGHKRAA
jgi:lambda repressor-like predicted transcriptional regulator